MKLIESESISSAWIEGLKTMIENPGNQVSPAMFSININEATQLEDQRVVSIHEKYLLRYRFPSIRTTASTIFPSSYWNPDLPRVNLYQRFELMWPRIKKCRPNRYGHYFQRLILNEIEDTNHQGGPTNQLELIITNLGSGNRRRSALQASIFIPEKDLTANRQRGFPCLQHVFFTPLTSSYLAVTGVYATQYLFDRAYGNILGLYRLGGFVAHETHMQLKRVDCFVSSLKLGKITKQIGRSLLQEIKGNTDD